MCVWCAVVCCVLCVVCCISLSLSNCCCCGCCCCCYRRVMAGRPVHICIACGEANARKRCGGCDAVHYCNGTCQKTHWPLHRSLCGRRPTPPHLPALKVCFTGPNSNCLSVCARRQLAPSDFTSMDDRRDYLSNQPFVLSPQVHLVSHSHASMAVLTVSCVLSYFLRRGSSEWRVRGLWTWRWCTKP
jgi:hypothetical protein